MGRIRKSQRDKLLERAERTCEVRIVGCRGQATNAHHRKNSSQGGTDDLSNLLLACGSGTTGCHGWITEHPALARANGLTLWRSDDPASVPVRYRGTWAKLTDDGEVQLLRKGQVRNELGHLSVSE